MVSKIDELNFSGIGFVNCNPNDIPKNHLDAYIKKSLFVKNLNRDLFDSSERYKSLAFDPIRYEIHNGYDEVLVRGWRKKNVTMNSLPALGVEFMNLVMGV